jgi:hypothetical protein
MTEINEKIEEIAKIKGPFYILRKYLHFFD